MPPFDPFTRLSGARREERERLGTSWLQCAAAAGSLNTGTMFACFADGAAHTEIAGGRGEGGGNITNDGSKADLIPSSDAAIAAFVDLAAVKWRRYGYQGQKRRLLVLFPFFFFFSPAGASQITCIGDTILIAALSGSSIWHRATEWNRPLMQPLWRI